MAGIIKAGTAPPPGSIVPSNAYEFGEMGESYTDRTRREAQLILARAKEEAVAIRQQAMEEGRRAAMHAVEATLRTKIDQQLSSVVSSLNAAIHEILQSRQQWQRHWEQSALQLSTAIAARIVRREVEKVPLITVDLVREALQLAAGNQSITLRLNPADHIALKDHISKLTHELAGSAETRVISDPGVTAGGCRVDTEFGSIDQQFETQIARILEELN